MNVVFGSFEFRKCGLFSFTKIWHHNPMLSMSEGEQLSANIKIDPTFCTQEYIPPAVKIMAAQHTE